MFTWTVIDCRPDQEGWRNSVCQDQLATDDDVLRVHQSHVGPNAEPLQSRPFERGILWWRSSLASHGRRCAGMGNGYWWKRPDPGWVVRVVQPEVQLRASKYSWST